MKTVLTVFLIGPFKAVTLEEQFHTPEFE